MRGPQLPQNTFATLSDATSPGRTARELAAQGAVVLDVRTPEEYRAGHVGGALNIPLQELPARVGEVGPRERAVVVYCRTGRRSAEAARVLVQSGFSRVHDMGPMLEWGRAEGFLSNYGRL